MTKSLQDTYAPNNKCFGCGPKNDKGLRIKSYFDEGDGSYVCHWSAKPHHQAFDHMLNGGICGALLDCHSNWAAAHHLMMKNRMDPRLREDGRGGDEPPCTVTAEFSVKLLAPTPMDPTLEIRANVIESTPRKAIVDSTLSADGQVTATCRGIFVAVKEGHPAYHRW